MRVKICGITRPEQGRAIAQLGATCLGFMCVTASPRYVTPEQIRRIVDELPTDPDTHCMANRVGVFVNATLEEIERVVAIAHLNAVQLHGDESPAFCLQLRRCLSSVEVIKALRIRSPEDLQRSQAYEEGVDTLLLDAHHPTQMGGTGKTLDWDSLSSFHPHRPWLLAGGITPNNVLTALDRLSPDGIDLSSGVERAPGDKDLDKVTQLFAQLRQFSKKDV